MVYEERDFRLVLSAAKINFSFKHLFHIPYNNENEEYVDSKVWQLCNIGNNKITTEKWTKTKRN